MLYSKKLPQYMTTLNKNMEQELLGLYMLRRFLY